VFPCKTGLVTFYADGTFRDSSWGGDVCDSHWKVESNFLHINHTADVQPDSWSSSETTPFDFYLSFTDEVVFEYLLENCLNCDPETIDK
jgi:hypothetical protein